MDNLLKSLVGARFYLAPIIPTGSTCHKHTQVEPAGIRRTRQSLARTKSFARAKVINWLFLCLILSFYSCEKQKKTIELPCEKVYMVECRWIFPEDNYKSGFHVVGYSELDKNFNLQFAYQSAYDSYYSSSIVIADSLKSKIAETINAYPMDTTLSYHFDREETVIYDGNSYLFIFQKNENELTRIYFIPELLPQDLSFLYNCLYEDRQRQVWKNKYEELFTKFEEIIKCDVPPPPILKETIQFTPPIIKKGK